MVILIATIAGRDQLLSRTLKSISDGTIPNSLTKIIVVENGKKGKTEHLLSELGLRFPVQYEYINKTNKSVGLNFVLKKLPNCLVLFTDDDVRFHQDTMIAYEEESRNIVSGVFYGGRVGVDYEIEPSDWLKPYLPGSARGWKLPEERPPYFWGCNWAAYVNDIKNAGFFDPIYDAKYYMGEDSDMQIRLIQNGLSQRYIHEAVVWHYVPKNRCTPIWALKRAYKIGYYGDDLKVDIRDLQLRNYPKRIQKILFGNKKKPFIERVLSIDRAKIFGKLYWLIQNYGYLQGRKRKKNVSI